MTMLSIDYLSRQLIQQVHVNVILPHDGIHPEACTSAPWKTLYLLHGYTGNSNSFLYSLDLERLSKKYGIAIVMPDGVNSFYVNHAATNQNYETMVAKELVDVTRKLLPLSTQYEDTWIGGISMGGFGALMLGLRHRETFSKIVSLSPAASPYGKVGNGFPISMLNDIFGSYENYLKNYDPYELLQRYCTEQSHIQNIFMCCGLEDLIVHNVCEEFIQKISSLSIPIHYVEDHGGHDVNFWNKVLPLVMDFLTDQKGEHCI